MSEWVQLNPTQLSALLDEIGAMVRANRSLVPGLRTIEDERLGRIGRAARQLRTQLEAGQSMEEVLTALDHTAGPQAAAAFRLAISGRSAEPLHRLANALRRRRELRLAARMAMVYPAMVVVIGYLLWVLIFAQIVSFGSLDGYETELFPAVALHVGTWLQLYWWIPPLVVIGLLFAFAAAARLRPHGRHTHWLPGRFGRIALFCDSLAFQIEAGVPYPVAVRLAADISGDEALTRAARRSAEAAEQGMTANAAEEGKTSSPPSSTAGFPPMIGWLVKQISGQTEMAVESLVIQLRSLAAWYESRQRSQRQFWVRFLPALVVAVFGGTLAIVYMLAILRPLYARIGEFG